MDECGEKEARKGLTVANKRHDPKIKDWTGPGSVGVSEQATVSDSSSSHLSYYSGVEYYIL